jgi:hypothetical protein
MGRVRDVGREEQQERGKKWIIYGKLTHLPEGLDI